MKRSSSYLLFLGGIALAFSFSSNLDFTNLERFTSGPPASRSGAPGESSCTSCHNGSVMVGDTENQLMLSQNGIQVDEYIPGETYDVSLSMASNPNIRGFQATVLDASNDMAGSFNSSSANGINTQSGMGRSYVSHNTSGSSAGNFPSWEWEWIAPATDVGEVTFYVATNAANGNGGSSGDVIYNSSHTIGSTLSVGDLEPWIKGFTASFNAEANQLFLNYSAREAGESFINLVDMTGKSVFTTELTEAKSGANQQSVRIPDFVKGGTYIVHFFINNQGKTATILINR